MDKINPTSLTTHFRLSLWSLGCPKRYLTFLIFYVEILQKLLRKIIPNSKVLSSPLLMTSNFCIENYEDMYGIIVTNEFLKFSIPVVSIRLIYTKTFYSLYCSDYFSPPYFKGVFWGLDMGQVCQNQGRSSCITPSNFIKIQYFMSEPIFLVVTLIQTNNHEDNRVSKAKARTFQ